MELKAAAEPGPLLAAAVAAAAARRAVRLARGFVPELGAEAKVEALAGFLAGRPRAKAPGWPSKRACTSASRASTSALSWAVEAAIAHGSSAVCEGLRWVKLQRAWQSPPHPTPSLLPCALPKLVPRLRPVPSPS